MLNLLKYKSYRSFLKDHLDAGKKQSPPLTLAGFAKKLKMSPSALHMLLDGKRDLTVHNIHRMANALGLTEGEEDFFSALVHFEQAEEKNERSFYEKKLKISKVQSQVQLLRVSNKELLSDWFLPTLLIYALDQTDSGEQGDRFDYAKIYAQLGLSADRAKSIFGYLSDLGILVEDREAGKIHIVFDKLSPSFSKKNFLKKLLNEVQRRIETDFQSTESYFEAHTLNLCSDRFAEFIADYKALLERYIALGPKSNKPAIYQSFQAFIKTLS